MPNRTTTALALALLCVGGAILILAERRQRPDASHGGAGRAAQDGGLDKTVAPRLHGDTPANSGSNGPRDEAPVPTIAAYWRGLLDQALAMPAEGGLSREDPLFPREKRLRAIQHMDPVDEASVLSLIGALADIDVSVNQVAESAVEGHERVLLPLLCSTYHELRGNVYGLKRNITGVLAKYAAEDEAAMTVVELAAVDDDAAIRYAAVDGVARAEPSEETNHILVSALVDSRSFVRTSAALALARQGDQRGIDEVFGLYRRGDPDYRCWLLKALAKQPSFEPWHEIFASSLGDVSHGTPAFRHAEPTEVRWIAAGVLIGIGGDEVRSFLRGIADGVPADARLAVSVCLSSLGASLDSCGADLATVLTDPATHPAVLRMALRAAAGCMGDEGLRQAIVGLLGRSSSGKAAADILATALPRTDDYIQLYDAASSAGKWYLLMGLLKHPSRAKELSGFLWRESAHASDTSVREAASYVRTTLRLE